MGKTDLKIAITAEEEILLMGSPSVCRPCQMHLCPEGTFLLGA